MLAMRGVNHALVSLGIVLLPCSTYAQTAPPSPPLLPGEICLNTCTNGFDACADGGAGAEYTLCAYGTDCDKCSPRPAGECNNACQHASDGYCQDGGPGSEDSICLYGSDCIDCGSRSFDGAPPSPPPAPPVEPPPPPPPQMPPLIPGAVSCTNTCTAAYSDLCNDGGTSSTSPICEYGTDCSDCGPRFMPPAMPPFIPNGRLCLNTCGFGSEGCHDGGPGSESDFCEYGTDCASCGPRDALPSLPPLPPAPPAMPPYSPGEVLCNNTCGYVQGVCEDAASAAGMQHCPLGSDCDDCGPRLMPPPSPPSPPAPPKPPPFMPGSALCSNTCTHASNGFCSDGGPGSEGAICEFGTDCEDCGTRMGSPPPSSIAATTI